MIAYSALNASKATYSMISYLILKDDGKILYKAIILRHPCILNAVKIDKGIRLFVCEVVMNV